MGAHDNIAVQSSWLNGQMILQPGEIFGQEYFVDGTNGNSGNDGLSWATALDTIANGVTAVDTYRAISGNANKRCHLYLGGGDYSETVTDLPNSCDIIGCGTTSGYPSTMTGLWTIAARVTGCRIYNLKWNKNSATTVVSFADGDWYNEFHNCVWYAGGSSGYALDFVDGGSWVVIDNCQFTGNNLYTTAIHMGGQVHNCRITNNIICASGKGIHFAATANTAQTVVAYNIITSQAGDSGAQLAVGIHKETQASAMIVNNWISAVDALQGGGDISNYTIANWIVQAGTGATETSATTAG